MGRNLLTLLLGGDMHRDSCLDVDSVMREPSRHQSVASYGHINFLWCLLSVCLACACAETPKIKYLSAAEIQESIIGNSLKGSDSGLWEDHYVPGEGENLAGDIRGRSSTGPYVGRWSIDGDSMCMEYPAAPEESGCYRFSTRNENEILGLDEDGAVAIESELVLNNAVDSATTRLLSLVFRQETVTFQHRENTLVGDLRLPDGPAPYPAVAFVHGSGPASRHSGGLKIIGNEFLSRGFATLIWSKPGVDESTGDYLKQSMDLRAEEVAAAMTHLAERADIDGDRIGLWGGSQAGWVMPLVPAHRNVAFVISNSGSGQSAEEQDLYLANNDLIRIGISEDDRADALEHIRVFYDMMRESVDYEEFLPRHEEWLAEMKLRSWYPTVESKLDELMYHDLYLSFGRENFEFFSINLSDDANRTFISPPQLKNLYMPVLAIYGTKDPIVDSETGSKAYEEIPRLNGNSDVTVKLFEGADHGIGKFDSEGYADFAPGYLMTMGDWLAARR
jgi:pimeloyl-ACP methyl ester carboxylesterase